MTDNTKQIIDEQNRLWKKTQDANEKHLEEDKRFKSDFNEKWDKMNAKLDELDDKYKKAVRLQASPSVSKDDVKQEYKGLFLEYLQKGRSDFEPEKKARIANLAPQCFKADVLSLTNAAGGYAVPETLYPEIQRNLLEVSPLRAVCRNVVISGNALKVNAASTAAAAWDAEGTFPTSEYDPTFSAPTTITPYALNAFVQVSREALADIPNIEGFVMSALGDAIAQKEGNAFAVGTGSSSFGSITGLTSASGLNNKAAAATGAVTIDELMDLAYGQTKQQYQSRGMWTFNRATLNELRQLKDSNNQYLWQPAVDASAPANLLGWSYFISQDLPSMATTTKSILFGDFAQGCLIVDRVGMTMDRLVEKDYPFIDIILSKRTSFAVIKAEALGHITMA